MAIDWTPIFEKYKGLWIALKDDEQTVVGSGKTLHEALEEASKNGYDATFAGQPFWGGTVSIGTLASVVIAFIYGTRARERAMQRR